MPLSEHAARDLETFSYHDNGQDWLVTWHPPTDEPEGTNHGASGVCVTAAGDLVLVRWESGSWMMPGGRPDSDEGWEETLRREVLEEACAIVTSACLLGFARSECVRGRQQGTILVRSYWRAEVDLLAWEPEFEMVDRLEVPVSGAVAFLRRSDPSVLDPVVIRAFVEAGLDTSR